MKNIIVFIFCLLFFNNICPQNHITLLSSKNDSLVINLDNYIFNEDIIIPLKFDSSISYIKLIGSDKDNSLIRIIDEEKLNPLPYFLDTPKDSVTLFIENPIQIEVFNDCNVGYVIIKNDKPKTPYFLITQDSYVFYLPNYTDTIYNLPSGKYKLSLYEEIEESIEFEINITPIDAILYLPNINFSCINPLLNMYSMYSEIKWDFGDGTILYNQLNPTHCYSNTGKYNLKVTIYEKDCYMLFEREITINEIGDNLNPNQYMLTNKLLHKNINNFNSIEGKIIKNF